MTGRVWTSDATVTCRRLRTVLRGVRLDLLARGRRHIHAAGFRCGDWRRPVVKRRQPCRPGAVGYGGYR